MKIASVEAVVVNASLRNWVFVKISTDEPGLTGWGEASLEWKTQAVVGAIRDLEPLLMGQDPRRIEHLWQTMYRAQFFKGGIVTMSAISGIDIALYDIKAKALGVPVFELLGGRVRDRVHMYDHLGGGATTAVYDSATPDTFACLAQQSVDAGFDSLKVLPVPPVQMLDSRAHVTRARALMEAVRSATGIDANLMVDFHGRTTPAMAIRFARALEEFEPWFIEEPCQPEDASAMAEVARAVAIPIASGERLVTRWQFLELLSLRACAVIQPDVCHCGGLSEMRRIASLAEAHQIAIAPHNPLGPIATMANIHFDLATSNFLIQEVMRSDVAWRNEIVDDPLVIRGGYVEPPTKPGLGLSIDETAAADHPYQPEPTVLLHDRDNAILDW